MKEFAVADHKKKTTRAALDSLNGKKTVLLVDNGAGKNITLGTRNLEGVQLLESKDVNPYHLLWASRVLISESAAKRLSEGLA